jgi:hypothetical protein
MILRNATLTLILILLPLSLTAESSVFRSSVGWKEDSLNLQYGIGWGLAGIYGTTTIPPMYLSGEYNFLAGEKLPLSLGMNLGFAGSVEKFRWNGYTNRVKYEYILSSLRCTIHYGNYFEKLKSTDLYAGVSYGGGWILSRISGPDKDALNTDDDLFTTGGYLGIRYYPHPNLGLFLEGGYGQAIIQGGVVLRYPFESWKAGPLSEKK